jgi:hypothetical protein
VTRKLFKDTLNNITDKDNYEKFQATVNKIILKNSNIKCKTLKNLRKLSGPHKIIYTYPEDSVIPILENTNIFENDTGTDDSTKQRSKNLKVYI